MTQHGGTRDRYGRGITDLSERHGGVGFLLDLQWLLLVLCVSYVVDRMSCASG